MAPPEMRVDDRLVDGNKVALRGRNVWVLRDGSGTTKMAQSLAAFEFIPGVAWSDHVSFWRQGYRAVMVTDTAFYRYAYYHTARDTPEKLNYAAMGRVVDGLEQTLAALAG